MFPLIQGMHLSLAGKITGMLLEIDNSELLHMLESPESLRSKVMRHPTYTNTRWKGVPLFAGLIKSENESDFLFTCPR